MSEDSDAVSPQAKSSADIRSIFRRIGRNAGKLFGGRMVFGLLNLGSSILAVRAVGLENFGVIVLLQAYVRLISGLLKFRSWAAVTKFGADALQAGRNDDFRRLIGLTLRLDVLSLTTSVILAMLLAPWASSWLGWSSDVVGYAIWFTLTIPFITAATPTGMMRLFDRFEVLVQQHALNAIIRFIGVLIIFLAALDHVTLIFVYMAGMILSGLYLWGVAFYEAHTRGLLPRLWGRWSMLSAGFPRIWRFVVVTNLTSMMDTVLIHATVLVVGGMLGPTAAGLFGVVKQLTEAMNRSTTLLGHIVFPEFAWLEAQGDRKAIRRLLWRMLVVSAAVLAVLCVILTFASEQIMLIFTKEAVVAAPLLVAMGIGAALVAMGFALEPAILTVRKERALLIVSVSVTLLFCAMLYFFILQFGLLGAGIAIAARQGLLFLSRVYIVRSVFMSSP